MGEHSAIPFFGSLLGLIHLRFFRVGVRLAPEREGIVKQHEFADEIDQLGGDLLVSEVCQKVRGNAAAVDDLLPGFEEIFQNVVDHLAGSDVLMANRVKLIHAEADAEEAVFAGFFPALPLGAVAAGGSQTADHFAVRDIHQRVEMQSSVLLSVLEMNFLTEAVLTEVEIVLLALDHAAFFCFLICQIPPYQGGF